MAPENTVLSNRSSTTKQASVSPVVHRDWLVSLLVLIAFLVAIETCSRLSLISPMVLPSPTAIGSTLADLFTSGMVWPHLESTLVSTALGFMIAVAAGVTIAAILTAFHRLERIFYPFIVAFQTLPKIAIAPLVIIWLGFGSSSKITIVAIVSFFPILVNTMQGLRLRDPERQELMTALGASKWQTFRYVRLPAALPYIFAGLQIGIIFALIGTVAAEFVGSSQGLGVLLIQQKALFNVPAVYAVLVIFMVLGVSIHVIMRVLEHRITFWDQESRSTTK
jgi:NitT/TauT family transport system permease protein